MDKAKDGFIGIVSFGFCFIKLEGGTEDIKTENLAVDVKIGDSFLTCRIENEKFISIDDHHIRFDIDKNSKVRVNKKSSLILEEKSILSDTRELEREITNLRKTINEKEARLISLQAKLDETRKQQKTISDSKKNLIS